MPTLTADQMYWLEDLLNECDAQESRLNDWERKFVSDQRARMEELGDEMWLSPKQHEILLKIESKFSDS